MKTANPRRAAASSNPAATLPVDGIGEVVEEKTEDVGPARTQAPSGGVGDVTELLGGGANRGTGRLADPWIVLEGAGCGRFGRAREAGDVGEDDPTLRRAAHQARLSSGVPGS